MQAASWGRHLAKPRSPLAPGAETLANAARVVATVAFEGRSAEQALSPFDTHTDRAAIRAIALGTMRWYLRLLPAVNALLQRPESLPVALRALLVTSAHQIEYSQNAPQATVHMAVDAARALGFPRMTGLVNAVLRRFVSERSKLFSDVDVDLASRTAHPGWLVEQLRRAWPMHYETILAGNNEHPPMVLRVDLSRGTVDGYLAELSAAGIEAQAIEWAPAAVRLSKPVPVSMLPGFSEGRVSVQDAGAQLAAPLVDAKPAMRVLDACAAPGGKTGHLLEHTPGIAELVAVDVDAERLSLVRANLERLGRRATLVVADMRDVQKISGGRPFDRILVDAPCSSTGVIRRHPDIKLLRRPGDIAQLASVQLEILRSAFAMLAPGGRLVYCTCSVLPQENEDVVRGFMEAEPRAQWAGMPHEGELAPGALDRHPGVQLLPGCKAGSDGFYYACLKKATTGN